MSQIAFPHPDNRMLARRGSIGFRLAAPVVRPVERLDGAAGVPAARELRLT